MGESEAGDGRSPLGELVRGMRQRRGLTQRQLAETSGISERAIQDLERGRTRSPQFHTLNRLAEAMQLEDGEREELRRCSRPSPVRADEAPVPPSTASRAAPDHVSEPIAVLPAATTPTEVVAFVEEMKAAASRVFELDPAGPGVHADFLLRTARGTVAASVRLVMDAASLLRHLEPARLVDAQRCAVVVCREFAEDFDPVWSMHQRASTRLLVVRHEAGTFDWLSGVLSGRVGPVTVRGSVYCTEAVAAVAARPRGSTWGSVRVVLVVVLLVVVGVVVAVAQSERRSERSETPWAPVAPEILSPPNGARVPGTFVVHGTALLPPDGELWLFVQPDVGDPSFVATTTDPIQVDASGNWAARITVGRGPRDVGLTYRLTPLTSRTGGQVSQARRALPPGHTYVHLAAMPSDGAVGPAVTVQRVAER